MAFPRSSHFPTAMEAGGVMVDGMFTEIDQLEERERQLLQTLRKKKQELKENLQLKAELTAGLASKMKRESQLRDLYELGETSLQFRKREAEDQEQAIAQHQQEYDDLLNSFHEEIQERVARFTTAPDRYHIEKISAEIESCNNDYYETLSLIEDDFNPKIANSESLMQNEPISLLELPDSSPKQLTSSDLKSLISKFKESTQKILQQKDKERKENEELKKKEASLRL